MPRKPKTPAAQLPLAPASSPVSEAAVPAKRVEMVTPGQVGVVEYPSPAGDLWRVTLFDALAGEFPFASMMVPTPRRDDVSAEVKRFHLVVSPSTRAWRIVARLYGFSPIILPADARPEDHRVWSRLELGADMALDQGQLQLELDAVRVLWNRANTNAPTPVAPPEEKKEFKAELPLDAGEEILKQFGLTDVVTKTLEERQWLIGRVDEWRTMFLQPMAVMTCRSALVTELQLRRLAIQMSNFQPLDADYNKLLAVKKSLEESYRKHMDELDAMFSWRKNAQAGSSFRESVWDLVQAVQAFQADGDKRLTAQLMTAGEVEILHRGSLQAPTPRYRLGQHMAILEAIGGMFDRGFRSQLQPRTLRRLDVLGQDLIVKAREIIGEHLPDLEAEGPAGEYPDFEQLKVESEK